jgi:hypothetical protein
MPRAGLTMPGRLQYMDTFRQGDGLNIAAWQVLPVFSQRLTISAQIEIPQCLFYITKVQVL